MHWIDENILRSAIACWERGTPSKDLYAKACREETEKASISADFTRAIAAVVESWEKNGFDGHL